jgi:hypothetical protein
MLKQDLLVWTEYVVNWFSVIPVRPVIAVISLIGLIIGALLIFNPLMSIEIQRIIYAKMNWKIEPISLPKKIRSLRLMGSIYGDFFVRRLNFLYRSIFSVI